MDLKRRLRRCPQSDVDWVSCVVTAAAPSSFQLSICQPDSTTSNTAGHTKKSLGFRRRLLGLTISKPKRNISYFGDQKVDSDSR